MAAKGDKPEQLMIDVTHEAHRTATSLLKAANHPVGAGRSQLCHREACAASDAANRAQVLPEDYHRRRAAFNFGNE